MPKNKFANIPIFIPELACPHQCVFCDQEKISSHYSVPEPREVNRIVNEYLDTMNSSIQINIAFFGGNFTGIPLISQEAYLKEAYKYVKSGKVQGIRISTRPDYINREVLQLLKQYGVTTIEIGAQSTNDKVLRLSGRGHTSEDIKTASDMVLDYGFDLGLQMMIGLPGDSYESAIQTCEDIINLGATNTRIYPTLVIKGTALENLYIKGSYSPLPLDEAVNWTKALVRIFDHNNVTILRIGLHPSEDLCEGKSLVAGPFHPSFKELVMTAIWNDIIKDNLLFIESNEIVIHVNKQQLNYAVGYKSMNRIELSGMGIKVRFIGETDFKKYEINVSNS